MGRYRRRRGSNIFMNTWSATRFPCLIPSVESNAQWIPRQIRLQPASFSDCDREEKLYPSRAAGHSLDYLLSRVEFVGDEGEWDAVGLIVIVQHLEEHSTEPGMVTSHGCPASLARQSQSPQTIRGTPKETARRGDANWLVHR